MYRCRLKTVSTPHILTETTMSLADAESAYNCPQNAAKLAACCTQQWMTCHSDKAWSTAQHTWMCLMTITGDWSRKLADTTVPSHALSWIWVERVQILLGVEQAESVFHLHDVFTPTLSSLYSLAAIFCTDCSGNWYKLSVAPYSTAFIPSRL